MRHTGTLREKEGDDGKPGYTLFCFPVAVLINLFIWSPSLWSALIDTAARNQVF